MQSQLINGALVFSSHVLNMGLSLIESNKTPNCQWLVRQALTNRQNFAIDVAPLKSNLTGRFSQEALNNPFNLWRKDVIFKLIVKTVNAASLILLLREVPHTRIATFLSKNPVLVALPVIVKAAEFTLEYFNYFYRNTPHASVEKWREKFEQVGPYLDALSHATSAWVLYLIPIRNSDTELAQIFHEVTSVAMGTAAAVLPLFKNQGKSKSYEVSAALAQLNISLTQQSRLDVREIWFQACSPSIEKEDQLALLETMQDKAFIFFLQSVCQYCLTTTDYILNFEQRRALNQLFDELLHSSLRQVPAALVALQTELKAMKEVIEQGYMQNANESGSFETRLQTFEAKLDDLKKLNTSPDVQKLLKVMLPMLIRDLPSQQNCQMLAQSPTRELQMKAGQYFLVFDSLKEIDSSSETLNQAVAILRPIAEVLGLIRNR